MELALIPSQVKRVLRFGIDAAQLGLGEKQNLFHAINGGNHRGGVCITPTAEAFRPHHPFFYSGRQLR